VSYRHHVVSGHLEVERKYDVDGGFVLPDPGDLSAAGVTTADPPVEHQLEAVYHDTEDLRLAQARITLRRRTGGPDAGWHLKLPAKDGARRELHAPLGRTVRNPPKALLEPVRGILRGAPTGPVATLRNHRVVTVLRDGEGRALAEVADDTVTASSSGPDGAAELQAWREVEVELVDGDEALLAPVGEWLVAAGASPSGSASKLARVLSSRLPAPPTPPRKRRKQGPAAGEVVVAAVRAQVEALHAADVALRTDDPGAVHQLRVAGRRLRSILAAFRPVLERAATDPVRTELAWLGGELGQARDDQVALAHLRALVAEQPPELVLGPVAARLQQTALRSAAEGRERALATLSSQRYLRLLDALQDLVDAPPLTPGAAEPAEPVVRAAMRKAGKRLRRQVDAAQRADGEARELPLHEVRKAAKRVRYTAEVASTVAGRTKRLVRITKKVQKTLGALQDTVVTRDVCRRLGIAAAAAGENSFTFGLLHGLEEARAERARAAFADLEPDLVPTLRAATRS
jgi:CHAD domain-containing protein